MTSATIPNRLAVIGLGGTIATSKGTKGLAPTRLIDALLADLPIDRSQTSLETYDLALGPSASLNFDDVMRVVSQITRSVADGCTGAVVVQGTDTIEEVAFALELLLSVDVPVVVTGAMRSAAQLGADGPANLMSAIRVVTSVDNRYGVLVVLNDEVHAARRVRKGHTTSPAAFTSGEAGLVGRIHEERFIALAGALPRLPRFAVTTQDWPRVALLKIGFGDDGALLDLIQAPQFQGCVLEAMGGGHVPAVMLDGIARIAAQMPVILCSRTGEGRVCSNTYDYEGSEQDLLRRGVVLGGALPALKARITLILAIADGRRSVADVFAEMRL
jgi:L-asparaginase